MVFSNLDILDLVSVYNIVLGPIGNLPFLRYVYERKPRNSLYEIMLNIHVSISVIAQYDAYHYFPTNTLTAYSYA